MSLFLCTFPALPRHSQFCANATRRPTCDGRNQTVASILGVLSKGYIERMRKGGAQFGETLSHSHCLKRCAIAQNCVQQIESPERRELCLMEQRKAENLFFDRTSLERLASLLESELQEARKREKQLLQLLEQEQRCNAAWERLFDERLQHSDIPQGLGEEPKEFDIRENRAKLLECLQNHYPHPLSPAQIQRFLGLRSNPFYTLARMAKAGILKRPSHGLYAIADEHVQLWEAPWRLSRLRSSTCFVIGWSGMRSWSEERRPSGTCLPVHWLCISTKDVRSFGLPGLYM